MGPEAKAAEFAPSRVDKSALLKRFLHGLVPQHCQALYHEEGGTPRYFPDELLRRLTSRLRLNAALPKSMSR